MLAFNWPIITFTTIILYGMIILFLPFSTIAATIMLFSLIAFWSRLPGFCVMEPVRFLYMMDLVDIFEVLIAMHVGIVPAVVFALVWNIYPWICGGGFLSIVGTAKDGVLQAFLCLFVPLMSIAAGGDIFVVIIIFSALRIPLYFIISLFVPHRSLPEQIFQCIVAGFSVLIINAFYAKIFGDFFTRLIMKGATFSWTLFFAATIIIIILGSFFFRISPKKVGKRMGKQIVGMAKKRMKKPKEKKETQQKQRNFEMDEIKRLKKAI